MTKLTPEAIEKTAQLAQLNISSEEAKALQKDLEAIFSLFDALNREDISALAPLGHPLGGTQPLREDKAVAQNLLNSIEQNAPHFESDFIVVPKVIE